LAEEFGGSWTAQGSAPERLAVPKPALFNADSEKDINQSHLVLGGEAPSVHDDDYTAAVLLNNVLGGPAMNSRLNMNIRERFGIAYQIESFINAYADGGHWGVYAGTDRETVDRAERLIRRELEALRQGLTPRALEQAKLQLLGQMALAQESGQGLMTGLGKSLLVYDRIDRFDELMVKVNALTVNQLRAVAERMFRPDGISRLRYIGTAAD
jgi:predicted Zn-dependent peptidase